MTGFLDSPRRPAPTGVWGAVLLLLLAVSGCSSGIQPPASPNPTPAKAIASPTPNPPPAAPGTRATTESTRAATAQPLPTATPTPVIVPGGVVVQGGLDPIRRVDPLAADLNPGEQGLADLLFESLLTVDPLNGSLQPGLAERWVFSADGLEATFWLQEEVRWHDGRSLLPEDVARTLEWARDRSGGSRLWPRLRAVDSVEVTGERQVSVTFQTPDCWAFWELGQVKIVPQRLLGAEASASTSGMDPVGTGPFRWGGQESDGRVVLEANRDYWDRAPYLDGWVYQPFPDAAGLQRALAAGVVDAALWPDAGPPPAWDPSAGISLLPLPGDSYFLLVFNTRRSYLQEAAVRGALGDLVDRETLLREVAGTGMVLDAPLPPGHWALESGVSTAEPQPVAAARRSLGAAGWLDGDGDGLLEFDGRPVVLAVEANQENALRVQTALRVAEQLRRAGVPAELQAAEWGVLFSDLSRQDFDLAVTSLPFHVEPAGCSLWREDTGMSGEPFNWPGMDDGELLTMLQAAAEAPGCQTEERAALYQPVWGWLARERPYQFLFSPARWLALDTGLKGLVASPFRPWYWNARDWYWVDGRQ